MTSNKKSTIAMSMLNNEYPTVVKVTDDNQILEELKGNKPQDELDMYSLNFSIYTI